MEFDDSARKMQKIKGLTIKTPSGKSLTLTEPVRADSRSVVFEETSDQMLVRLFLPTGSDALDTDLYDRLGFLSTAKMPDDVVVIEDLIRKPYVGYTTRKPEGYQHLSPFLVFRGNSSYRSWYNKGQGLRGRLSIGRAIAKLFYELEGAGLTCCEVSGETVLVRPGGMASVRMLDAGRMYVGGKISAPVIEGHFYAAPEVLDGEMSPGELSDDYALALIIFDLLHINRPRPNNVATSATVDKYDGFYPIRLLREKAMQLRSAIHDDPAFTNSMRDLFDRCICGGSEGRALRPSALDFEIALLDASNRIVQCPKCGAWFYQQNMQNGHDLCPWCNAHVMPAPRLDFYEALSRGEDYRTSKLLSKRLVRSYILKPGINPIPNYYVFGQSSSFEEDGIFDDCLTITKDSEGCRALKADSKSSITVYRRATKRGYGLGNARSMRLQEGDRIFFGEADQTKTIIGDETYFLSSMAEFSEAL